MNSLFRAVPLAVLLVAPATAQAPARVAIGSYECWANGRAGMLLNFKITSATAYTDSDDRPGTYSHTPSTTRITFKGGALEGVNPQGFYTIYPEPNKKPNVNFRNATAGEISFFEKAR